MQVSTKITSPPASTTKLWKDIANLPSALVKGLSQGSRAAMSAGACGRM